MGRCYWVLLLVLYIQNGHFATPCYLCSCFAVYTDRAQTNLLRPYATSDFYNTTEVECLAACLREKGRCKGVVYGLVGDREMFICELYQRIKLTHLLYAPFTNVYVKKSMKCTVPCKFMSLTLVSENVIE
ncbi:unnamed protein product [Gongylonema pulchrum]|uniref:Apple domain-containing protein n=1 Tax=Gongylonema pulchrum TaxID=637853 RepID=A0A183D3E1_9BILA|nr:unnamed protein product [Gongylonema pulchrum]